VRTRVAARALLGGAVLIVRVVSAAGHQPAEPPLPRRTRLRRDVQLRAFHHWPAAVCASAEQPPAEPGDHEPSHNPYPPNQPREFPAVVGQPCHPTTQRDAVRRERLIDQMGSAGEGQLAGGAGGVLDHVIAAERAPAPGAEGQGGGLAGPT
jgi:hypothetical protein